MRQRPLMLHAVIAALLTAATLTAPVWAAEFPNRPVTVLIGFPPGTSTDAVARIIGRAGAWPMACS